MDTTFSRIDIRTNTNGKASGPKPSRFRQFRRVEDFTDAVTQPHNLEVWKALCCLPDGPIRDAVKKRWAEDSDDYITQFGALVRELKQMDPRANAGAYYHVVKVWHFLNGHCVPGRTLASVLAEFADYWNLLEAPDRANQYMIDHIRATVDLNHDDTGKKVLDALIAFAKLFRSRQYFCAVRTLAESIRSTKSTVARHLAALEERGAIRRYSRGGPHIYKRKADAINVAPSFAVSDYMASRGDGKPITRSAIDSGVFSACVPPVPESEPAEDERPWWLSEGEMWEADAERITVLEEVNVYESAVPLDIEPLHFGRDYGPPKPMADIPIDW